MMPMMETNSLVIFHGCVLSADVSSDIIEPYYTIPEQVLWREDIAVNKHGQRNNYDFFADSRHAQRDGVCIFDKVELGQRHRQC